MPYRTTLESWGCFKATVASLASKAVSCQIYEISQTDDHYELLIECGVSFSHWVEKGTNEQTEYEESYQSTAVICHC